MSDVESPPAVRPVSDPVAAAVDVAAVLLFVVLGRRSHDEGSAVVGTLTTAWPFVAGVGLGWAVRAGLARGSADSGWAGTSVRTGAVVLAGAVVGGMALRRLTGGGTPTSFVLVASSFLALFLLGWRATVVWRTRLQAD
jgi:hypothetical protein